MQIIKLDFQKTDHILTWKWISISLLIVVIVLNALLVFKNQKNIAETNKLLGEIEQIKQPVTVVIPSEDDSQNEALKNQLKEADIVIKQLNLPWPHLLKVLEGTREKDIDLLAVTPNAQTGEVIIIGQTESLELVFNYMERLEKSQIFSKVALNSHQKVMHTGIPSTTFTIATKWSIQ